MARRRFQHGRVVLKGKREPKWFGRWREDFIQADGSIQRVERSVVLGTQKEIPTARLAKRRLVAILARVNAADYRPGRAATIAEFARRWLELFLSHRKPSTVHAAKSHLRRYILPLLGKMGLNDVGKEAQQQFAGHVCRSVSPKTALNILGTLSSMLSTAKAWGYICQAVDIGALALPDRPKPEPRCLTADQARRVVSTARFPYRAMFAIAAMTGMRAGEIMGIESGDIDFGRRLIFVRRSAWRGRIQTPKSQASVAVLPMPDALAEILREYVATRQSGSAGLLFPNRKGKPCDAEKVVRNHLRPILDGLGIARCGFHAFRHMHTSLLLETGASPKVTQAQLRHSDARVTLGVYGHIVGDSHRQAVERVAEILRPNCAPAGGAVQVVH